MYIEPNPTFEEIEEEIRVSEMVEEAMNEAENSIIQINYTGTLIHKWFKRDDPKQKMVAYAYKLWWMDFVKLIECENWNRDIKAVWDSWKAFWLCQINTNYHRLPENFKTDWRVQIEECYRKWKWWTKFYWPSRLVKGVKCYKYVQKRFTIVE